MSLLPLACAKTLRIMFGSSLSGYFFTFLLFLFSCMFVFMFSFLSLSTSVLFVSKDHFFIAFLKLGLCKVSFHEKLRV